MAAVDEFPRGWTLTADSGSPSTITIPAIPGVAHVLDSIDARLVYTGATTGGELIQLSSSGGTYTGLILGRLFCGAANTADEFAATGLDLAASPGESLTVAFGGHVAGEAQFLMAQGHDI